MKPITKELFSSIFHAGSEHFPAETYFQLVRGLRQQLNALHQTMTDLELRRQKLESNEVTGKTLFVDSHYKYIYIVLLYRPGVCKFWKGPLRNGSIIF